MIGQTEEIKEGRENGGLSRERIWREKLLDRDQNESKALRLISICQTNCTKDILGTTAFCLGCADLGRQVQEGGELRDTASHPTPRAAQNSAFTVRMLSWFRGRGQQPAAAQHVRALSAALWSCLQHRVCRATCSSTVCHGTSKVCVR